MVMYVDIFSVIVVDLIVGKCDDWLIVSEDRDGNEVVLEVLSWFEENHHMQG